jgi:hypothetical protein
LSKLSQAEKERDVFGAFAGVAPLDIDIASIQSRKPPEPDIICCTKGGDLIRFELTELIDRGHMERVAMMGNTTRAIRGYYENELPEISKDRFDTIYGRAHLHFAFSPGSTLKARKARLPRAFEILIDCRESLSEFTIKNDPDLLPELAKIRVKKTQWNGPVFDTDGFGWLGDPTEETIKKKLAKPYEGDSPIELLAYIDWDLLPPEGAWKAAADRAIECMEGSSLSRIWVFNLNTNEIMYVFPDESSPT